MPAKTACVVGAGVSGITALKECLRQGFKTTCYELDSDIIEEHTPANTAAVWDTLVTNVSKFNCCFTDFPPSANDTLYLSVEATYNYLKRAVAQFGLEECIQLNTRVIKIAVAILTDSIAEEIGIYPSFWKVVFRNPVLAFRNWYGPIMAAQLNLVGPDSQWETAEAACISQYKEGCSSIRHRSIQTVDRPDMNGCYRSPCVTFSVLSVFVSLAGFLWYRYQEKIYLYL